MMHRSNLFLYTLMFTAALAGSVSAQRMSQSIDLQPGWNAVYLEVNPEYSDPSAVFDGLPVKSVWRYNRTFDPIQFFDDPANLKAENPDWLVWYPADSPSHGIRTLFSIFGPRPFLIELGGSEARQLTVTGKPRHRAPAWLSDSYNLVGFPLADSSTPSFNSFFASSASLASAKRFRLDATTGRWEAIVGTMAMKRGEAFWQYSQGQSSFVGALEVDTLGRSEVDFGDLQVEARVLVTNRSSTSRTVTARVEQALAPSNGILPLKAGPVPLSHWEADLTAPDPQSRIYGYIDFDAPFEFVLTPGASREIILKVRRADMAPFDSGGQEAEYQSLLRIDDGQGFVVHLPVRAKSFDSSGGGGARLVKEGIGSKSAHSTAIQPLLQRKGLWVGTVLVNAISEASNPADKTTPTGTSSSFPFRVIVHVDEGGNIKFLQQVFLMFKPPIFEPDPEVVGGQRLLFPGRPVLVTNDSLLGQYEGADFVDGQKVGRRLSTTAFAFKDPIAMTVDGESLDCSVFLDYDDPLNPFVHRFHPEHNNLNLRFTELLSEGVESFDVMRALSFEFMAEDPNDLAGGGWGDTTIGGVYREVITGIHKEAIHLSGTFRLNHVLNVEVLNDGVQ